MDKTQMPDLQEPKTNYERFKVSLHKLTHKDSFYLFYAFIIPVIIMYLLYLAMEIYPFGNGSVLVLDMNGQYVDFFKALQNYIHGDTSLLYSFSRALGGEFLGIYAYYIASPLSYIVGLFPNDRILEALLVILILKTGLCGLSFGYYLKKTTSVTNKIAVVTFSAMYALCAYAIVYQHNTMWIDAVFLLPLICYGIEELIKYGKYKLFIITLALCILSNVYIGFMVCIFVVLYFLFYYFAHNENFRNNPNREKSHFVKSFVRIGAYSLIALGIAAVLLVSSYYAMSFGKSDFSNPNWAFEMKLEIMDIMIKFLPGSYDTVRPEGLPWVYTGLLTLIMVPLYFVSKKYSMREKVFSAIFISVFILSFTVSVLDLVWHFFQRPNWLNHRYSFMLCFFMLVLAYKGFIGIRNVTAKSLFAISGFLILFIAIAQKFEFPTFNKEEGGKLDSLQCIWLSVIFIAIYLLVLCVARRTKWRSNVAMILCIVVCTELFANGLSNMVALGNDVVYSSYSSYNDYIKGYHPIMDELTEYDDSFYRMEKISHRKTNDNMSLNIRGLSNSTSTLNSDTIEFLRLMGYSSKSHWSKYHGGNPVNDSLLGLKYILAESGRLSGEPDAVQSMLKNYYDFVLNAGDYSAYYNKYALSIAYAVDNAILDLAINEKTIIDPHSRLNAIITAMLGESEVVNVFSPISVETTSVSNITQSTVSSHIMYSPIDKDSTSSVTYKFQTTQSGEIFFYVPSEYQREVAVTVNGRSYGTFFANETWRSINLGSFDEGTSMIVTLKLNTDVLYVKKDSPLFYNIDKAVFEDAFSRLAQTQLIIDEDYKEDKLPGTITTLKDSQMIQTTIPYDAGWSVTVDGIRVETFETLNALMAFKIETAGEHKIVMKYMSSEFMLGMTLTLLFSTVYILLFVFDKKFKSKLLIPQYVEIAPQEDTSVNTNDVLSQIEPVKPTEADHIEFTDESTNEKNNE